MSSTWFARIFSKSFEIFSGIFGNALAVNLTNTVGSLVKDDLGRLAIDAVIAAEALAVPNDPDKRAAAKATLKADLVKAGVDLEGLGESVLNLLIELAVQYLQHKAP